MRQEVIPAKAGIQSAIEQGSIVKSLDSRLRGNDWCYMTLVIMPVEVFDVGHSRHKKCCKWCMAIDRFIRRKGCSLLSITSNPSNLNSAYVPKPHNPVGIN